MIGLKLAATGALVALIATWIIAALHDEIEGAFAKAIILALFFGGWLCAIGGLIWWIWS